MILCKLFGHAWRTWPLFHFSVNGRSDTMGFQTKCTRCKATREGEG